METEREVFGRADVIVMESDDGCWLYAACARCTHTLRMPSATPRTFADQLVAHQWEAHHRAWLAVRFGGVDATFMA